MAIFEILSRGVRLLTLAVAGSVCAMNVVVTAPDGTESEIYISDRGGEAELRATIEGLYGVPAGQQRLRLDTNRGGGGGVVRDYNREPTAAEKKDIGFIIKTMANTSLIGLLAKQKKLNEAGQRVQKVHPLRFLQTIFEDDELNIAVRNVKKDGHKWGYFMQGKDGKSGLEGSFNEESGKNNLTDAFIEDFCDTLAVSVSDIRPRVLEKQWDSLVTELMDQIPLPDGIDDYDM